MNSSNTSSPTGKIARLPDAIRDQLNCRLHNVLAARFDSGPGNKPNLQPEEKDLGLNL